MIINQKIKKNIRTSLHRKGSKRNFKSYNVNHEEQNNSDSDSDSDSVPDPSFDFYSNITIIIIENNYNSIFSIIPIET